jgi:starvation-inducible outer membrane lipoprotein
MPRPLIWLAVTPLLAVLLASCASAPKKVAAPKPTPEVTPSYSVLAPVNKARSKTGAAMEKEFERARQDPEASPAPAQ